MNGLKEYRQSVASEANEKRHNTIEQKLDEILALLKGEVVKTTKDSAGKVVSTQTETGKVK